MQKSRMTIPMLHQKKQAGEKIAMVTAYDYPTARLAEAAGADIVLVGDSAANVVLGYETTIPVTLEEMLHHTRTVSRGIEHALLVADMPFMSFHISREETIRNAGRFMKETGATAVKIEGAGARCGMVEALTGAEIPVMGHIGLTPQSIYRFGEFRVQGTMADQAADLLDAALALEQAGAFAIVLELVPTELASTITSRLSVPTIGIGAGPDCDGQVLVFHDLCGLNEPGTKRPKHVREYVNGWNLLLGAVRSYVDDVRAGSFPDDAHSFHFKSKQLDEFHRRVNPVSEE